MENKIPAKLKDWVYNDEYIEYEDVVSCFGNIVIKVNDDSYSGDERYLLEKDGKYGYIIIGFGSCTGCDWLLGCDTEQEKESLIFDIKNDIKWFDNLSDLQRYFSKKDWELEYSWHADETKDFINKVINLK